MSLISAVVRAQQGATQMIDAVSSPMTVPATAPRLRCGTDLIRISRIARAFERQGDRFSSRIYTASELADCGWPTKTRIDSLAVRFAAKEAVSKALGTGIGPRGVRWTDIQIVRVTGDAPRVQLQGAAAQRYFELKGQSISISMSHDGDLALAFCVLDCAP